MHVLFQIHQIRAFDLHGTYILHPWYSHAYLKRSFTCLRVACWYGSLEMVKRLHELGGNLNTSHRDNNKDISNWYAYARSFGNRSIRYILR